MSEKVTAGVDLDALERRGSRLHEIWVTLDHAELAALIAELRAARAVVEAARSMADSGFLGHWDHKTVVRMDGKLALEFGAALAAYDRLTGERQ